MAYDLFKDYLPAINYTKKNLMDSDDPFWAKKYPAYMVNKVLSSFIDTLSKANEINKFASLDNDMQFQFLLNSIRSKKRFTPYLRSEKIADIECVKEYYGYNMDKARTALKLLTKEQLILIKQRLFKGGKK